MASKPRSSLLLFAVLLAVAPGLASQQIAGRVVDAGSGQPMAAVQVFIAGSGIGALTQQNGRYLLLNVPAGQQSITAQRIGYKPVTQQVTVTAGQTVALDFQLAEEALGLDEIVVTGTAGGTQKRALGNAVATIATTDVLGKIAVNGIQDVLTGRVPGAQFRGINGSVGTGGSIQIRGAKSFNLSGNPLIFVDGVRMNNSTELGPSLGDRRMASSLDNINPQDIESIQIIKGPAAATLYGTEASAGVVQIITKRGAQNTPVFQASVRQGVNYMSDPAGRLGGFWACTDSFAGSCIPANFDNPAGMTIPATATKTLVPYNPYTEANRLLSEGMWGPWPADNVYRNGLSQSYNLQVTGGGQSVRYFLSGNFDKDEGADVYNWNQDARLRSNTNVVFSEKIAADVSMGFTKGFTRFGNAVPTDGGSWDDFAWGDGYCIPGISTDAKAAKDQMGRPNPCPRTLGFQQMLPTDVEQIDVSRDFSNFTGSATLNFTPTKWLTARGVVGLDKGWETDKTLFPLYVGGIGEGPGLCGLPQDIQNACQTAALPLPRQKDGELNYEKPNNQYISLDVGATARFDFMGGHLGTATSAGLQYYDRYNDSFLNVTRGFSSPLSTTINQGTLSKSEIQYKQTENKSAGMFVQEEFNWNRRLFITGAMRFDANSAFGSAFKAEKYPKVSATWTVSDESFWHVGFINSLRLRSAFGSSGRQPDTFSKISLYAVAPGPVGSSALVGTGSGNPDVRPEKSQELESGFDVSFFDGKISSEFTYFRTKTTDALLNVPQPPTLGLVGSVQQNIGRIDNWGWEESLHTRLYQTSLVTVGLDLSGTHTDNMIKDIGAYPATSSIAVGWPYPNTTTRYRLASAAYDAAGKKVDPWGNKIKAMCDPGVKSVDGVGSDAAKGLVLGGALIDCQSKDANSVLIGRAFFNYQFSATPSVDLFNSALSLHAMFDGQFGSIGTDERDAGVRYFNTYQSRCQCDPLWVAEFQYGDKRSQGGADRSFVKFREIGARYTLPSFMIQRIGANRGSLAVSGRELGVLWRKEATLWGAAMMDDPEKTDSYRATPALTRWTAELNFTF